MTPTLESVLFASASVALNANRIAKTLAKEDRLFANETLNSTIVFKYPNFDAAQDPPGGTIPGLEDIIGGTKSNPVRTAIFVPKDANELRLGGFGLYMDDEKFPEMSERYIGFRVLDEGQGGAVAEDAAKLKLLDDVPALDPFLLKEAFDLEGRAIHEAYTEISKEEAFQVRERIRQKLRPIIGRALDVKREGQLEKATRQFLDTIWDPKDTSGAHFIAAFGISMADAPKVFSAWKGVAYFDNEFTQRQADSRKMVAWLKSEAAFPTEYPKLTSHEKQQFDMFRKAVTNKVLNVSNNISLILNRYETAYKDFIQHNDPRRFRQFLQGADRYYWTLGACNGVLAQVVSTWQRYMALASGGRLGYDVNERLLKVCDAILRARSEDKSLSL